MYTLVIYDISDDLIRQKVAEACKEVGLVRIQKSAFLGIISFQVRKSLKRKLEKILGNAEGNIQLFAICDSDIRYREVIGKVVEGNENGLLIL